VISVVIVAFESGESLTRCLDALAPAPEGGSSIEAIVVNNGTRGPEIERAEKADFVRVATPGSNVGFAAGANLGARRARGEILVFLNPDAVAEPAAVAELARVLADRSIGVAMPRLRLLDRPELLNSAGNELHITGLAWAGAYGERAEEYRELREITYASGAAMAIRAELFWELGGFTEELFMYQEDLELSWRARLRGYRIVLAPGADVYHEYEFGRNPAKQYFLERNRLIFVLSAFSPRLLLLLAPVLTTAEIALLALAAREGWARAKLAGWWWCARHLGWLVRHRKETQRLRRIPDRELAPLLSAVIAPGMMRTPKAVELANPVVNAYWTLAQRAL
jgi:GT2 family glycosyltransferase